MTIWALRYPAQSEALVMKHPMNVHSGRIDRQVRLSIGMLCRLLVGIVSLQSATVEPASLAEKPGNTRHVWSGPDGRALAIQHDTEILEFLRNAKVVDSRAIPVGVAKTRRLTLEKEGIQARAAFRTIGVRQKHARLTDGKFVSDFRDDAILECAAYQFGQLLAITSIPPAVERTIGDKPGSVQLWVENAMTEKQRRIRGLHPDDPASWEKQLQTMLIFDSLIDNKDRNLGNRLIDQNWRLWLIDHTQSFGTRRNARNLSAIRQVGTDLWERLNNVSREQIEARLKAYLDTSEIEALLSRRKQIVRHLQDLIEDNGSESVLVGPSQ